MEKHDYSPYIIGGVALLLVVVLCFSTATWILCNYLKANGYVKTQAEVIDFEEQWTTDGDGESSRSIFYTVEFDVDGQTYHKRTTGGKIFGGYYIGDIIDVYYNPQNPDDVLYKKPRDVLLSIVCYIVAGGCALGAFFLFRKYAKLKK